MQQDVGQRKTALFAMVAACAAVFLTALDQTVVVTALPQIITDLQIPPTQLDRAAWIVSGYLLGYVIVMPLMGRVSDLYGRRVVFTVCMGIFALGSLLCGWAPQLGEMFDISFLANVGINVKSPGLVWLVAARFVQAAGGGAIVPVAMAIAGDFYGYERRGIVLGLIGMVTEAGGALGPLYGSLVLQVGGWPAIFYLNIPLVALLLVPIWLHVPGKQAAKSQAVSWRHIDAVGSILLGLSLICLSLGLAQEAAQITPDTFAANTRTAENNLWLIAAALVFLAGFIAYEIFVERRQRWPLIELSLFKRPAVSAAALVSLLVGTALIIAMVDIPIFFLTVFGSQELDSGLALLRLTAMIPVGAIVGGWLCNYLTCRWTAVIGLLTTALGFWLMHLWPTELDWIVITSSTLVGGFGLGLVISPISTTAINAVRQDQLGMASSIVTVLRMIGMILGLAILTSWGLGRFRALVAAFRPPEGVTRSSPQYMPLYFEHITNSAHNVYTSIFLAAGVLCFIAIVPALFLEGKKPKAHHIRTSDKASMNAPEGEPVGSESEEKSIYGQRQI